MEGLFPPTGIEPTPLRNLVSKVAGLQVHTATPGDDKEAAWLSPLLKLLVIASTIVDIVIERAVSIDITVIPCSRN